MLLSDIAIAHQIYATFGRYNMTYRFEVLIFCFMAWEGAEHMFVCFGYTQHMSELSIRHVIHKILNMDIFGCTPGFKISAIKCHKKRHKAAVIRTSGPGINFAFGAIPGSISLLPCF